MTPKIGVATVFLLALAAVTSARAADGKLA